MRAKQVRVVLADDEMEAALRVTSRLGFDFPGPALRALALAVDGDERSLARVHPFLRDFRARLAELDQEGR